MDTLTAAVKTESREDGVKLWLTKHPFKRVRKSLEYSRRWLSLLRRHIYKRDLGHGETKVSGKSQV